MVRLIFVILLFFTTPVFGAPTYDNAASTSIESLTSMTISGFTTTGSNRLLTSCLAVNEPGLISAHNYNTSESMTLVDTATWSGDNSVTRLYRLINPTVGSHDLTVTFSDVAIAALGAISFAGAHQTVPLGTAVKVQGVQDETTTTITVTSANDEIVLDCFGYSGPNDPTFDGSQTERWDEAVFWSNGTTKAGAASVVMEREWAPSSFQFVGLIGVSVKPAAAATTRRVNPQVWQ